MQYEYDSTGDLFNLVLVTFLIFTLTPLTYRAVRPKRAKNVATQPFPVEVKDDEARNAIVQDRPATATSGLTGISLYNATLALGWAATGYLLYRVANTKREENFYNPFAILGISESATEKEIKKHYKRMSVKFHPDKVRLTANQTLEQVQEVFVNITKAYKALTDEEIRNNYIEYGHPDGRQDTSVGIALPTWIVQGGSSLWVLGGYCALLIIGLPLVVGRWWAKSSALTKDGLLTGTAETFLKAIKTRMTYSQLIAVLGTADEYKALPGIEADGFDELIERIKARKPDALSAKPTAAEVLIHAHLGRLRVPTSLVPAQTLVLKDLGTLSTGLLQVILAFGYLDTSTRMMQLSSCLAQGLYWDDPVILQLPYTSTDAAGKWAAVKRGGNIQDALETADEDRTSVLGLQKPQYAKWLQVALGAPDIDIGKAEFKVEGDAGITPSALVNLVVKLRRASEKPVTAQELADDEAAEGDVDALMRQEEVFSSSAVPDTLAWAPLLPTARKNHFWLAMVDGKQDRVIIGPVIVEDVGDKVRTYRLQFKAPHGVGVYTFQLLLISDTYRGLDKQLPLMLNVQEEAAVVTGKGGVAAAAGGEDGDEDDADDISEPDEDSVAGQMAALRGHPTKQSTAAAASHKSTNGVLHEYSSSEGESDDDEDEDDSSDDSDSDSDDD